MADELVRITHTHAPPALAAEVHDPPKQTSWAYFFWLFSFLGLSGLHRFYVGKPITGLLWLFTGGLVGFGTLWDLFTLPSQVRARNRELLYANGVHIHVHGQVAAAPQHAALPPRPSEDLERTVLKIAHAHGGTVTAQMVALHSDFSLREAKAALQNMAEDGYAELDIGEDGSEQYRIAGLTPSKLLLDS